MACVLAAFSLLACSGDDDPRVGPRGVLRGQVVRAEDGEGYGPVPVALFDLETLLPARSVDSDADGRFVLDRIPPGRYVPVVYDLGRELFHLPQSRYDFTAAEGYDVVLPVVPAAAIPLSDPSLQLRGRVVERGTGRPIVGALVEMSSGVPGSTFSELEGRSNTLRVITDERGLFRLWPLLRFPQPGTEQFVTPHWRVTRAGYRSHWEEGTVTDRIPPDVEVLLEPGVDPFAIEGDVFDLDGRPVIGVTVAAEWRRGEGVLLRAAEGFLVRGDDPERRLGKILGPGWLASTDATGHYRIEGLPAGGFLLRAAPYADDGRVGTSASVQVESGAESASAPALLSVPAMRALAPAEGDTVVGELRLAWASVEGALAYRVIFRRGLDGQRFAFDAGADTTAALDPSELAEPGLYLWELIAFDAGGERSRSERSRRFVRPERQAATFRGPDR